MTNTFTTSPVLPAAGAQRQRCSGIGPFFLRTKDRAPRPGGGCAAESHRAPGPGCLLGALPSMRTEPAARAARLPGRDGACGGAPLLGGGAGCLRSQKRLSRTSVCLQRAQLGHTCQERVLLQALHPRDRRRRPQRTTPARRCLNTLTLHHRTSVGPHCTPQPRRCFVETLTPSKRILQLTC